jgi:hypothetical protein
MGRSVHQRETRNVQIFGYPAQIINVGAAPGLRDIGTSSRADPIDIARAAGADRQPIIVPHRTWPRTRVQLSWTLQENCWHGCRVGSFSARPPRWI